MSEKKPTIASLQRRIQILEAQLNAAHEMNTRIGRYNWDDVMAQADIREKLRQIAEIVGPT